MGLIDWGKTHWTALLIGLSILAIIIFIVYYFFKPGAYICGAGTTQDKKCGTGGCIKICTGGTTYDCTKHSCVCNPAQGLVQCGDSCCPAGSAQHPDPSDPDKCICCAKSQLCGETCCPTGETCSSDKTTCVVGCGMNHDGSPHSCSSTQTCVTIDNIPSSSIKQFTDDPNTVVDIDPKTGLGTAHMCHDAQTCNTWSNQQALPPAINNWYPCLNFMNTDPSGGVGFCSANTDDPADISVCKGFAKDQCPTSCTWVNIFDETRQGSSGWTDLDARIKRMSGGFGDWCAQGSSGRVTSVDFDPATCSWKDCWAKLAQGNVTDLDYDEASGRCVAIQSCNTESYNHTVSSSASDPSTDIVAKTGGNLYIKDCSAASADSCSPDFGHCPDLLCNPGKRPPIVMACDPNGPLVDSTKRWICSNGSGAGCIDVGPGQGVYDSEETCMANCTCPPGFKQGLDLKNPSKCARVAPFTLKSFGYAACSPTHNPVTDSCDGCNTDNAWINGCVAGQGINAGTYNGVLPINYQVGPGCGDCSRDVSSVCRDGTDGCCNGNYMGIGDTLQIYPQNAVYCKGTVSDPSNGDDRAHSIANYNWQVCNDKSPDWNPSSSSCINPHYHGQNTGWGKSGFWRVDSTYTSGSSIANYCYENDLPASASCHNV